MLSKNGYIFDTTCLNYFAQTDSLSLLEIVSRDDAWRLHEQMTNMPQDPYWSPVKSKQKFQEQVDYHAENLSLGQSIF